MKALIKILAVTVLISAFSVVGVSEDSSIKIGLLLCLSGPCSEDGLGSMKGAQLAAKEINESGGLLGRKIYFVIQDSDEGINGAKAAIAFRQMRGDQELRYIIGPTWSPGGLAVAPIASKERDLIIASPSLGAPAFHKAGDNIFNMRGVDEISTREAARYTLARGHRKVAIMSSQQPWEAQQREYFQDEFQKLGGEILRVEEPLPSVIDIRAEISRIVHSEPDAVFLSSIILLARGVRELRQLNFSGFKIASNIDHQRIMESQGALEGTVFFNFPKPGEEFHKKYFTEFNDHPPVVAGFAYDAVKAFAASAERASSFETEKLRKIFGQIRLEGASGSVEFDVEGCAEREPIGLMVKGADFESLESQAFSS